MNKIIEHEDYIALITKSNEEILVDKSDYDRVKQHAWYIRNGYAVAHINGKTCYLHRVIMDAQRNVFVDHINHNKLNNRRSNLRLCTRSENAMNMIKSSNCSSRFKGVVFDKSAGRYKAEIKANQRLCHLGRFDNEIDAAIAYNKAALIYFGEFAKLNDVSA